VEADTDVGRRAWVDKPLQAHVDGYASEDVENGGDDTLTRSGFWNMMAPHSACMSMHEIST
jgi:hypothetical protein